MTGLDCNILVQLAVADHPQHQVTLERVRSEIQAGEKLFFPPLIATEFLHVVTGPRRINPPLTMQEAISWLKEFLAHPAVSLVPPTDSSVQLTLDWMLKFDLGRKRILDTHLAAILHAQGISRILTSNPADFGVFRVLNILTP